MSSDLDTTVTPQGAANATDENVSAAFDAALRDASERLGDEIEDAKTTASEPVEAEADTGSSDDAAETSTDESQSPDAPEADEATPEEREKGYLRMKDYTQKTMQLGEERKTLEVERTKFNAELEATKSHWVSQVQAVEQMILKHDPVIAEYAERQKSGWAEYVRQEPAEAIALEAAVKEKIGKIHAMKAQVAEAQKAELGQFVAKQQEALFEKVPEYRDATKYQEAAGKLGTYLRSTGFDDREIKELVDHRHWLIAEKAMRWDAHQAAMKSVQAKKVQPTATKVVRPGASQGAKAPSLSSNSSLNKALAAAREAGDTRTEMAILAQMAA